MKTIAMLITVTIIGFAGCKESIPFDHYSYNLLKDVKVDVYEVNNEQYKKIAKKEVDVKNVDLSLYRKVLSNLDYMGIYLSQDKYLRRYSDNKIYTITSVLKNGNMFELTATNRTFIFVFNNKYRELAMYSIPDDHSYFVMGCYSIEEISGILGDELAKKVIQSEFKKRKKR